jgi:hypothetical protein
MGAEKDFWALLFKLGAIIPTRPKSTLYDVIVGQQGLDKAKRYVAGGHAISQRYAGGHSLCLAARHGDLEFLRYFIENAPGLENANSLEGPNDILSEAVERIAKSGDEALPESMAVFEYLARQAELRLQFPNAFITCAFQEQITVAQALIAAGLGDEEVHGDRGELIKLSERLEGLKQPDFAALIRGDDVDLETLKRKEAKEREEGDQLASLLGSISFGGREPELTGDAFTAQYNALIDEIRAGQWTGVLGSSDPKDARSVLEFAGENGFTELARAVLETHAPTDSDAHRAAIAAATYGHFEFLQVLAEAGVAVEKTSKKRNSPLSEACRYGHLDIVRNLLELGANPNAGDSSGHGFTLDDLAGSEHRNEIIAALQAHR